MVKQNITQTNKCSGGGDKLQNKIKKALPVILLLLLITVIIGVTYAVYNLTKIGNENTITTGLVSMSYTESTNVISIKDALPKSDAEGITQSEYFDFSVTSNLNANKNEPIYYQLEIEPLTKAEGYYVVDNPSEQTVSSCETLFVDALQMTTSENVGDLCRGGREKSTGLTLQYALDSGMANEQLIAQLVSIGIVQYKEETVEDGYHILANNQIKILLEDTTNNTTLVGPKLISELFIENSSRIVLYYKMHNHTSTNKSITTNYRLKAWIDYNTDASNWNSTNKYEYKFRINVNGDATSINNKSTLFSLISAQATPDTNIDFATVHKETGVYTYTKNGTTDDNGGNNPIYYYRGNVTNNNVKFANLCWKIIRTTSTGGVKLLYNGGVASDGTCQNFRSEPEFDSKFNEKYNSPADVGYMYGTRYTYVYENLASNTYKYGNDVTYSNGTYTLSGDTTMVKYGSTTKGTLAEKYHYTCLNSSGSCSEVYYITYFGGDSGAYGLTFTGGDTLETAKTKMFTNTNDSTIKKTIDNWYKTNLLNYGDYLENTIFCNDRSFASGSLAGKDSNAYTGSEWYQNTSVFGSANRVRLGTPSLTCSRQEDKFSLSVSNGGTNGYGNNALTYPVGLITGDEINLAGNYLYTDNSSNYLATNNYWWWSLSPFCWNSDYANALGVSPDARVSDSFVGSSYGVRPSVSLQPGTVVQRGNGTASNPYLIG